MRRCGNPLLPPVCPSLPSGFSPSSFSLLPLPSLSGKWGWLGMGSLTFYSQSVWVHHSLIEAREKTKVGAGEEKEKKGILWTPEVRGQRFKSRLPIYWKVSARQASMTFSSIALWIILSPFTPQLRASPCCTLITGVSQECRPGLQALPKAFKSRKRHPGHTEKEICWLEYLYRKYKEQRISI